MKKYLPYFITAVTALVLDQISKLWILAHFQFAERLNIIPGFFDLTLQKYLFMLLAFAISGWLGNEIRKGELGKTGNFAAAMIIGGAFGNVIDRFAYGKVVDFLLVYWQNWHYPVFNIADCFVCVGAVLLVIDSIRHKKKAA